MIWHTVILQTTVSTLSHQSVLNIWPSKCSRIYPTQYTSIPITFSTYFLPTPTSSHAPKITPKQNILTNNTHVNFRHNVTPSQFLITTATKVNLSKLFNHHHLLPIKLNNQHNHNQRLQKSEKLLLRCRRRKIHIMHKASREKHTRGFCRHKETESKSNNETQTESKSETQSESADSGFSTTRVRVRKGSRD